MKGKRYFCDRMKQPVRPQMSRAIVCSCIILIVLASIVLYNLDMKYGVQLGEYSEEVYEKLEEIADDVIEGKVINLDAMLDSVSNYEVTYKYGVLTFKCSINNYEGKELYPSPRITVTESSGVVKKEHYVSSEEEYIKIQKRGRIFGSIFNGMFICAMVLAVFLVALFVLYVVSRLHKHIDISRMFKHKKRPS